MKSPFFSALHTSRNGLMPSEPRYGFTVAKSSPNGVSHRCTDLHLTKMCCRISCGGRADIPTLHITDHNESFFVAVVHRSLESCKTRNSELLIHRNLRLHCRDQIIYFIYNRLIVLPYSLGRTFQRLAIFLKRSCLYLFRNIGTASGRVRLRSVHLSSLIFAISF